MVKSLDGAYSINYMGEVKFNRKNKSAKLYDKITRPFSRLQKKYCVFYLKLLLINLKLLSIWHIVIILWEPKVLKRHKMSL